MSDLMEAVKASDLDKVKNIILSDVNKHCAIDELSEIENKELKQLISELTEIIINLFENSTDNSSFDKLLKKYPYNSNCIKFLIKAGLKTGKSLLTEMIKNEDIEFLNFLIQNNDFDVRSEYDLEMFEKVKNKDFSAIAIDFYIKKQENEFKQYIEKLRKQYLII